MFCNFERPRCSIEEYLNTEDVDFLGGSVDNSQYRYHALKRGIRRLKILSKGMLCIYSALQKKMRMKRGIIYLKFHCKRSLSRRLRQFVVKKAAFNVLKRAAKAFSDVDDDEALEFLHKNMNGSFIYCCYRWIRAVYSSCFPVYSVSINDIFRDCDFPRNRIRSDILGYMKLSCGNAPLMIRSLGLLDAFTLKKIFRSWKAWSNRHTEHQKLVKRHALCRTIDFWRMFALKKQRLRRKSFLLTAKRKYFIIRHCLQLWSQEYKISAFFARKILQKQCSKALSNWLSWSRSRHYLKALEKYCYHQFHCNRKSHLALYLWVKRLPGNVAKNLFPLKASTSVHRRALRHLFRWRKLSEMLGIRLQNKGIIQQIDTSSLVPYQGFLTQMDQSIQHLQEQKYGSVNVWLFPVRAVLLRLALKRWLRWKVNVYVDKFRMLRSQRIYVYNSQVRGVKYFVIFKTLMRYVRAVKHLGEIVAKKHQEITMSQSLGAWVFLFSLNRRLRQCFHKVFLRTTTKLAQHSFFAWKLVFRRQLHIRQQELWKVHQEENELHRLRFHFQETLEKKSQRELLHFWADVTYQRRRGRQFVSVWRHIQNRMRMNVAWSHWKASFFQDIIATCLQKYVRGYLIRKKYQVELKLCHWIATQRRTWESFCDRHRLRRIWNQLQTNQKIWQEECNLELQSGKLRFGWKQWCRWRRRKSYYSGTIFYGTQRDISCLSSSSSSMMVSFRSLEERLSRPYFRRRCLRHAWMMLRSYLYQPFRFPLVIFPEEENKEVLRRQSSLESDTVLDWQSYRRRSQWEIFRAKAKRTFQRWYGLKNLNHRRNRCSNLGSMDRPSSHYAWFDWRCYFHRLRCRARQWWIQKWLNIWKERIRSQRQWNRKCSRVLQLQWTGSYVDSRYSRRNLNAGNAPPEAVHKKNRKRNYILWHQLRMAMFRWLSLIQQKVRHRKSSYLALQYYLDTKRLSFSANHLLRSRNVAQISNWIWLKQWKSWKERTQLHLKTQGIRYWKIHRDLSLALMQWCLKTQILNPQKNSLSVVSRIQDIEHISLSASAVMLKRSIRIWRSKSIPRAKRASFYPTSAIASTNRIGSRIINDFHGNDVAKSMKSHHHQNGFKDSSTRIEKRRLNTSLTMKLTEISNKSTLSDSNVDILSFGDDLRTEKWNTTSKMNVEELASEGSAMLPGLYRNSFPDEAVYAQSNCCRNEENSSNENHSEQTSHDTLDILSRHNNTKRDARADNLEPDLSRKEEQADSQHQLKLTDYGSISILMPQRDSSGNVYTIRDSEKERNISGMVYRQNQQHASIHHEKIAKEEEFEGRWKVPSVRSRLLAWVDRLSCCYETSSSSQRSSLMAQHQLLLGLSRWTRFWHLRREIGFKLHHSSLLRMKKALNIWMSKFWTRRTQWVSSDKDNKLRTTILTKRKLQRSWKHFRRQIFHLHLQSIFSGRFMNKDRAGNFASNSVSSWKHRSYQVITGSFVYSKNNRFNWLVSNLVSLCRNSWNHWRKWSHQNHKRKIDFNRKKEVIRHDFRLRKAIKKWRTWKAQMVKRKYLMKVLHRNSMFADEYRLWKRWRKLYRAKRQLRSIIRRFYIDPVWYQWKRQVFQSYRSRQMILTSSRRYKVLAWKSWLTFHNQMKHRQAMSSLVSHRHEKRQLGLIFLMWKRALYQSFRDHQRRLIHQIQWKYGLFRGWMAWKVSWKYQQEQKRSELRRGIWIWKSWSEDRKLRRQKWNERRRSSLSNYRKARIRTRNISNISKDSYDTDVEFRQWNLQRLLKRWQNNHDRSMENRHRWSLRHQLMMDYSCRQSMCKWIAAMERKRNSACRVRKCWNLLWAKAKYQWKEELHRFRNSHSWKLWKKQSFGRKSEFGKENKAISSHVVHREWRKIDRELYGFHDQLASKNDNEDDNEDEDDKKDLLMQSSPRATLSMVSFFSCLTR